MANLSEIAVYKHRITKVLCSSQEIVDLITNKSDKTEDFTHAPVPNKALRGQNIFPYSFVLDTSETARVFICFEVDVPRVYNKTFKAVELTFYVFSHRSLMFVDDATRIDLIAEEIDKLFNGSNEYGLGYMELRSVEHMNLNDEYHGRILRYQTDDWNR